MVHKKLLTVIRGALLVTPGSWAPALIKVPSMNRKPMQGLWIQGVTVSSSIIPLSLTLTSVLTALNAHICNHTFSISPIYLTHFPHLPLPPVCRTIPELVPWLLEQSAPLGDSTHRSAWPFLSIHLWGGLLNGNDHRVSQVHPDQLTAPSLSQPVLFYFQAGEPSPSPRDLQMQPASASFF